MSPGNLKLQPGSTDKKETESLPWKEKAFDLAR